MHDDVNTTQTESLHGSCGPSSRRNRFFRRKQMRAEEFKAEQDYFIGRRRLINRAVLGWGIAYGFPLWHRERHAGTSHAHAQVEVGPGFALDQHGRELALLEKTLVTAKNTFQIIEGAGGCEVRPFETCDPGHYVLCVHYAEVRTGDMNVGGACGCELPEKRFVCETVVFSLQRICEGDCPCAEPGCERHCGCGQADSCCGKHGSRHAALCQWSTEARVPGFEGPLCEWNGHWISPGDCVGLACVTVRRTDDRCAPVVIECIDDDCGPRRLLKGNELLFDLVRGCDLTQIRDISWARWHRAEQPMPWDEFAAMFHVGGHHQHPPDGTTEFVACFSGPVRIDTLRHDVVVMTAVFLEQSTGWRQLRRVPITRLDTTPEEQPDQPPLPAGTTNRMRIHVRAGWIREQMERGEDSWLTERDFTIEIEIRGDWILDCRGMALDANSIGLRPVPTGDGVTGGMFLSSFHVQAKPLARSSDRD